MINAKRRLFWRSAAAEEVSKQVPLSPGLGYKIGSHSCGSEGSIGVDWADQAWSAWGRDPLPPNGKSRRDDHDDAFHFPATWSAPPRACTEQGLQGVTGPHPI